MADVQPSLPLFDEQQAYIKGKLIHEIFHNPTNLYTVSRIRITETTEDVKEKEMIVVGNFPPLYEDDTYTFWGELKEHHKFGLQYHIKHYRKELPQGRDGIIQYLSSDLFPGVGKKTAEAIVNTLGEQAIGRILESPDILQEVSSLSEKLQRTIHEKLMEHQGLEQIIIKLSQYGIGMALSVQIYQTYQEMAMNVLEENPYQLIEDIEGIGFKRADVIGQAMGIERDAPERIQAAFYYYLREKCDQSGHVFYPYEPLVDGVLKWLTAEDTELQAKLNVDTLKEQIEDMGRLEKVIIEEDRVYLPSLFFAERAFAKKLKQLLQRDFSVTFNQQEFYQALGELEERLGIEYAPTQREAIERALHSQVMILTGGPGTGKTTVIKGVCELFAELHGFSLDPKDYVNKDEPFPVILVAPTGRAAKRMSESTGVPAVTIHRLLGWRGGKDFDKSEDEPIEGKVMIIDESSMMDQWLANQLFRALPTNIQVVFVGDQDQLPSVGPGQVLKDLILSERIPKVELQDIYRQAEGSSIITLAHQMKRGEFPTDLKEDKPDRRFFPCETKHLVDMIRQICGSAKRKGYTPKDIQVLAPMYRGDAGIDALNVALQEEFNPAKKGKREMKHGDTTFRVGDKVLQLANNPEQNVFNGDIGEVSAMIWAKETTDKEDMIVVTFDQTEVVYKRQDLNQLTLAYCCSIHKSQGSEFPIVVVPLVRQYARMLRRNLVYTAITRGKEYLILCGEERTFLNAINDQEETSRWTTLQETLQARIPDPGVEMRTAEEDQAEDRQMDQGLEKEESTLDRMLKDN
ncbi:ATP-dependent RecD-like DNA helicase [Caldalkalibacillus salinus]|uniref:SF1B family DNA helicase RecD2 n=1 Tax=Caldalkalibacillus salinus TaxID=2803787 RepID=UPI001EFFE3F9|nr:ATP-dependent RecD-like DNA helicase [Caldalkalibacillus salinus]